MKLKLHGAPKQHNSFGLQIWESLKLMSNKNNMRDIKVLMERVKILWIELKRSWWNSPGNFNFWTEN